MKTCQHTVEKLWYDAERRDVIEDFTTTFDAIHDAERRATRVFEMLLTVLSNPDGTGYGSLPTRTP